MSAAAQLQRQHKHDPYLSDRYFTDGVRLYRIAGWSVRADAPALAELEDCGELYTVLVSRSDLEALGLRPVAFVAD